MQGTVTEVVRAARCAGLALGIRFHTVVLANGDKLTLRTDQMPAGARIRGARAPRGIGGAAIGGAILGAILGGGKGAAIGAGVGAGGARRR